MSLENQVEKAAAQLERIADALESIVSRIGAEEPAPRTTAVDLGLGPTAPAAPAKTSAKPAGRKGATAAGAAPAAPAAVALTLDDATEALRDYMRVKNDSLGAQAILKKHGALRLSELQPASFSAFVADVKAAIGG